MRLVLITAYEQREHLTAWGESEGHRGDATKKLKCVKVSIQRVARDVLFISYLSTCATARRRLKTPNKYVLELAAISLPLSDPR